MKTRTRRGGIFLALLYLLMSMLVPGIACASTAAGTEIRVRAFDLHDPAFVGVEAALTLELRPGREPTCDRLASDSLLAARGGGKVGGKITGYTDHGLNQAIGRDGGRGVHPEAILDAVRNPTKVVEQAGGTTKYIGEQGTVILNSEGKVVTTWGRPRNPVPNR